MSKWLLPTISEAFALTNRDNPAYENEATTVPAAFTPEKNIEGSGAALGKLRQRTEREWCGAIAALSDLLEQEIIKQETENIAFFGENITDHVSTPSVKGLVLSGPVPAISHPALATYLSAWTFISEQITPPLPSQLLPTPKEFTRETDPFLRSRHFELLKFYERESERRELWQSENNFSGSPPHSLPLRLLANDPLTHEQFCVVLTNGLSLVMVLAEDANGIPKFQFSFDPEVVEMAWQALRSRVLLTGSADQQKVLDEYFKQFSPVVPHYKTVMHFSQLMLKYLPESADFELHRSRGETQKSFRFLSVSQETEESQYKRQSLEEGTYFLAEFEQGDRYTPPDGENQDNVQPTRTKKELEHSRAGNPNNGATLGNGSATGHTSRRILDKFTTNEKSVLNQTPALDVELLQAIAHEVRTPLTTIRTLTRLLLKRRNLDSDIIKRLESIDRECTEQIDRFNLFFRAVELETSEKQRSSVNLTSTSLAQIFNNCIPRWQKQASRRNLTLEVILPQKMPQVVSDPTMLDQVLTGIIENFTCTLSAGSQVQVKVMLAGNQLKVAVHSQSCPASNWSSSNPPPLKSIGQMLMFQPETGNITLNLTVTKHLFQALGGKLIVRERSQQGQVLTMFLPLEA